MDLQQQGERGSPCQLPSILSNVNPLRLERLLEVIERTNPRRKFLHPEKELVLVGRNPHHLYLLMEEILPRIMINYAGPIVETPALLPHHLQGAGLMVCYDNPTPRSGEPLVVISRTKGSASIVEKITRLIAEQGTIRDSRDPAHLVVEDVYGFRVIARTMDEAYALQEKIGEFPFLQIEVDKRRDYSTGNANGYTALHDTLRWQNGLLELNGLRIRVHYETQEDHLKNKAGDPTHPQRAHKAYAFCKLDKPHTTGNHQIVVVDHRGKFDTTFYHKHIDLSGKLNGEAYYDLLQPASN